MSGLARLAHKQRFKLSSHHPRVDRCGGGGGSSAIIVSLQSVEEALASYRGFFFLASDRRARGHYHLAMSASSPSGAATIAHLPIS